MKFNLIKHLITLLQFSTKHLQIISFSPTSQSDFNDSYIHSLAISVLFISSFIIQALFLEYDITESILYPIFLFSSFKLSKSTKFQLRSIYITCCVILSIFMVIYKDITLSSAIGSIFIIPKLILNQGLSLHLYILLILTQVVLFQARISTILLNVMKLYEPEMIVDKALIYGTILYIFVMIIHGLTINTLRTQSKELGAFVKKSRALSDQHRQHILEFSHELRNPLNSLLGNLNLALVEEATEKTRHLIHTAKLCSDLMLQHVNNILDRGKIEAGKLEIQPVSTRVHDLSQEVWAVFNNIISNKKLIGTLRIAKNMPISLMLDPHRVKQILLNLIGNAVKFTTKGSIKISMIWLENASISDSCFEPIPYSQDDEGLFEKDEKIAMLSASAEFGSSRNHYLLNHTRRSFNIDEVKYTTDKAPGVLKIVVTDSGDGMTEEEKARLFEKFTQVSDNIQHRQGGTGLGLYITKEICTKMQGTIKVFSRKGSGTTFIACIPTCSLPFEFSSEDTVLPLLQKLREKKMQFMLIDEPKSIILHYIEDIGGKLTAVNEAGHDSYMAYIKALREGKKVDIVILGAGRSKMQGKLMSQMIRQYELKNSLRHIPMMIINDADFFEEQKLARSDTITDGICNIYKPMSFDVFCRTLSKVMRID